MIVRGQLFIVREIIAKMGLRKNNACYIQINLAIDLFTMGNRNYLNSFLFFVDHIEDPVITNSNSVLLLTIQLFCTMRPRVISKRDKSLYYSIIDFFR